LPAASQATEASRPHRNPSSPNCNQMSLSLFLIS
jgi:hypothetical protein